MAAIIDLVITDCDDLSAHTGVTFILDLLVTQECSGLPNDLTGYSAKLVVFDAVDTDIIVEIPGVIPEPVNGVIHFELSAADTADLLPGNYEYHLEIIQGSMVYRLAQGQFEVTQ